MRVSPAAPPSPQPSPGGRGCIGRRVLLGALATLPLSAHAQCRLAPSAIVPLQAVEGFPVLAAAVNGTPVTFLLDTGAQAHLILPAAEAVLRLRPMQGVVPLIGTGGARDAPAGRARGRRLGRRNARARAHAGHHAARGAAGLADAGRAVGRTAAGAVRPRSLRAGRTTPASTPPAAAAARSPSSHPARPSSRSPSRRIGKPCWRSRSTASGSSRCSTPAHVRRC